jgi:hypothetical protein
MLRYDIKDIAGGLLLMALGSYVLYTSFGFGIGTATRMGAGYLPMVLGIALIAVGLLVALPAIRIPAALPRIAWRPFLAVISGMFGFYFTVGRWGLVPAIWILVGVSALADRDMTLRAALGLMALVSLAAWLLFTVALGLRLPAFRGIG